MKKNEHGIYQKENFDFSLKLCNKELELIEKTPTNKIIDFESLYTQLSNYIDTTKKYYIFYYSTQDYELKINEVFKNYYYFRSSDFDDLLLMIKKETEKFDIDQTVFLNNLKEIKNKINNTHNTFFLYNSKGEFKIEKHSNNSIVIKVIITNSDGSRKESIITRNNALPNVSDINCIDKREFENNIAKVYESIADPLKEAAEKSIAFFFKRVAENSDEINESNGDYYECEIETFSGRFKIRIPYEIKKQLHLNERLWDPNLLELILKEATKESYRETAGTVNALLRRNDDEIIRYRNLQNICRKYGLLISEITEKNAKAILDGVGIDFESGNIVDEEKYKLFVQKTCKKEESYKESSSRNSSSLDNIEEIRKVEKEYNTLITEEDEKLEFDVDKLTDSEKELYDDKNNVSLSVDEVGVKAQKEKRRDENYKKNKKNIETAVVHIKGNKFAYRIASDSLEKSLLIAVAFLVKFDLLKGKNLIVFSDGARNIAELVKKIFKFCNYHILLDWYHLKKRCYELLSMALKGGKKNKERNRHIRSLLFKRLFVGKVDSALAYLDNIDKNIIKDEKMIQEVKNYLIRKREYIYNYAIRKGLNMQNSSNRAEKLNDLIVAIRCKNNGRAWSDMGLNGVRSIKLISLNNETSFFKDYKLQAWEDFKISCIS